MTTGDHDKQVCCFAAQELAVGRGGSEFHPDRYPDEEERTVEAVDMIGHDLIGPVATEHTLIEAYEGQTKDNVRMHQLFRTFAERFGSELPRPGFYTVSVELGAAAGAHGKADDLVDEVERWIRSEAPSLPEPEIPPSTPNHVRATLPGPLPVMLDRLRDGVGDEGSLRVALHFPGDIEEGRVSRSRTSLE